MTRSSRPITTLLLLGCVLAAAPASGSASSHKLCVGYKHGCYSSIQAAVDAAYDGDTIGIAPGTFAGGVTIDKSIRVVGAGARSTVIKGGGPVLTIGRHLAPDPPTVTISGVTVTGGMTSSSPVSQEFGKEGVVAFGGGIEISNSADFGVGATVTIEDSVITRNRAAPTATVPSGQATCPDGSCPFAWAKGGGIDTTGPLTLKNTTVSDNTAGGVASDANGGGISVWDTGSLTMANSYVVRNHAIASKPNGRFAEGGGIFTQDGAGLTIKGGCVSRNEASLTSDLPYFVEGADPIDMNANGGGIHAGNGTVVKIDGTSISGNTVSVRDPNGRPYAFDSGLMTGTGPLDLRNSRLLHNSVVAKVGSSEEVGFSGEVMDIYGPVTVSHTAVTDNEVLVTSRDGVAAAGGAVYSGEGEETGLIVDSVIADNTSRAISDSGQATVQGIGLLNDGQLRLRNVLIAGNYGKATGPAGFAHGGGIWNGRVFNETGPIELALEHTTVIRNRVSGSAGIDVQGGGVFAEVPITLHDSRISGNFP